MKHRALMPNKKLPKEHVEALEKILGVKLPEEGFKVEIKRIDPSELESAELDQVSGGAGIHSFQSRDLVTVHVAGDIGVINQISGFIAKI